MKNLLLLILFLLGSVLPAHAAILQEDAAAHVVVWFYDATTGAPKTGLTVTSITCRIVKSDMTTSSFSPTASGGSNDMVEIGNGAYDLEQTSTQLNTAGPYEIGCSISGSTSPPTVYDIYTAGAYATSIGGSPSTIDSLLETDCSTVGTTTSWAYKLCQFLTGPAERYEVRGTADSGTTTTVVDTERTETLTDHWVPGMIVFTSGSLSGQARYITGFNTSTDTITFTPALLSAVTTETYEIRAVPDFMRTYTQPTGFLSATFPGTVASTTNITAGTITTVTNLTNLPTIPTNWITAGGINADAFTAAKFAADASTEFATTFFGSFIEGTTTLKQSAQYWNSALVGKYNSSGGTFNFRDIGDTKNRVVYTTTSTSRATVTLSPD